MGTEINCPNCGQRVLPQSRYCEHCGVDMALAAVLAEQQVMLPMGLPAGAPLTPEILVPRIGDYLIERNLLDPTQLQSALKYQKEKAGECKPILLGQALVDLGFISREVLDQAVTAQILRLQTALNETNQSLQQRVQERTEELQKALERLSELNHLKSNFIANISHELRTPLTHIKGYLDLLSDGGLGALNEAQNDALTVLKRAETRLEHLIEDLIQFSLASRGELSLNLQTFEIDKLINITIDRSRHKARTQGIEIKIDVPEKLPPVRIDEDKIGWVLLQLLDNAIKFTPENGQVILAAVNNNGLITISVTDNGIGIPEQRIPEIFEPFHQLDGSATRRYAGTGLGLAMVRRIIEAHGSQIKVYSRQGKGSRFQFSLPIWKPEPE
jgi:signal transduction histidine kinase